MNKYITFSIIGLIILFLELVIFKIDGVIGLLITIVGTLLLLFGLIKNKNILMILLEFL